jgi:hypothetical protein
MSPHEPNAQIQATVEAVLQRNAGASPSEVLAAWRVRTGRRASDAEARLLTAQLLAERARYPERPGARQWRPPPFVGRLIMSTAIVGGAVCLVLGLEVAWPIADAVGFLHWQPTTCAKPPCHDGSGMLALALGVARLVIGTIAACAIWVLLFASGSLGPRDPGVLRDLGSRFFGPSPPGSGDGGPSGGAS